MVSFIAPNAMTTIRGLPSRRNPNSPASPHSSTSVMDRSSPAFRELQRRGLVESSPNDNPVQRCRFSVPKCITKAMKAIGKFFRSIFKRFRSDLETTSVSRDPDVALDKGRQRWIVHSTNSQWQQELVDALIAQGVRAEDAEHVKTTRDRTFIAFDLQEFQVVQKHKAYHIRRIA